MAYIDEILGNGEKLVKQTHRHPFSLLRDVWLALLALLIILIVIIFSGNIANIGVSAADIAAGLGRPNNIWWLALIVAIIPIILIAAQYISWRNHLYAVTNRRVLRLTGVVNKNSYDVALEKINDILSQQNGFGRIFNFGDLQVESGNDQPLVMNGIADPLGFKKAILNAKSGVFDYADDAHAAPVLPAVAAPTAAPTAVYNQPVARPNPVPTQANPAASNNPTADALRSLDELREQGLITEQEYQQKRNEVLSRIARLLWLPCQGT